MKYLGPCIDLSVQGCIKDASPGIGAEAGLVYVPASPGEKGGLFTRDGEAVPSAVNVRGPGRVAFSQALQIVPPPAPQEYGATKLVYVGHIYPHFGHFITTTLSRFWPLLEQRPAGAKLLWHGIGTAKGFFGLPFVADILGAFGLGPEDFIKFAVPTRIASETILPAPAFEENFGAHTAFVRATRQIGARVLGDGARPVAGPAYLSKANLAQGVRGFVNEAEIDEVLQAAGVRIVYPERTSFAEQLAILASHRPILGSVGSGLHSTIFLPEPARIVAMNAAIKLNNNFHIIDALCGNDASYWYPLDVEAAADPRFNTAFRLPDARGIARELLALI